MSREIIEDLVAEKSYREGNFKEFSQVICKVIANFANVSRVGVWLLDLPQTHIYASTMLVDGDIVETDIKISKEEYPVYFGALNLNRSLIVNDTYNDPVTQEFVESYLTAFNITSMLDTPIREGNDIKGVICIEHTGPERVWSEDIISFAGICGDLLSHVLLLKNKNIYQRAIDQVADITISDTDGRIIYGNDVFLEKYKVDKSQIGNIHQRALNSGFHDGPFFKDLWETIKSKKVWNNLILNKSLEGEKGWNDTTIIPIEVGGREYYFTMRIDRSEQKRLEDLVRKSAKLSAIGEISASILHEVSSPLTTLGMVVELLEMRSNGEFKKEIDDILKASKSVQKIFKNMRKFLVEGELDRFERVDLLSVISAAQELIDTEFKKNNIQLEIVSGEEKLEVFGDATSLTQVFSNLIKNAIDAIANLDEKWIKIILDKSSDRVLVKVIDSGNGLSEEVSEKLFEPLFSTKKKTSGTGMGMSIIRNIIIKHNASINYLEDELNTTFLLKFYSYK